MNDVVATSDSSRDTRARLGIPGIGNVRNGVQSGPRTRAAYEAVNPPSAERQIAALRLAWTRSHDATVVVRGPSGLSSGESATCPYPSPRAVERNTRCGTAAAAATSDGSAVPPADDTGARGVEPGARTR